MKKVLLVLGMVALTFSMNAQSDTFTYPNKGEQLELQYVIIEKEGTAGENYNKLLNYIVKNYKNPDVVIKSKIDGDYIRMEGIMSAFSHKEGGTRLDTKFHYEFKFKNNKMRIELISLKSGVSNGHISSYATSSKIYKKDGSKRKLWDAYATRTVEAANYILDVIISNMDSQINDDDNW